MKITLYLLFLAFNSIGKMTWNKIRNITKDYESLKNIPRKKFSNSKNYDELLVI